MQLWKLPEIRIAPEKIFDIFGFPVTNTLLCAWIAALLLLGVLFLGMPRRDGVPSGLQNVIEWFIEILLGLVESVSGKEKGRKFFPIVASFFLFIFMANLLDLIPGVDTVGVTHGATHAGLLFGAESNKIVPWIRPATTDLNLTLAMALVSVVITQVYGFAALGANGQLSKYFNFKALISHGPLGIVEFIVGLLEIVSEVGRLISFSFRLFGNIFAGSVLLAVFAFLLPVVANIIFLPFELFVAAIQAFVFSFLTLLFLELGTTSHAHEPGEHQVEEYEERKGVEPAIAH